MTVRFSTLARRAAVLCGLALTLALFTAPFASQANPASEAPRLLTVSGSGEASGAPDRAQISAGVVTEEKTAAAALAANNRAMTQVFAALNKLGIADKSIRTSNFSVSPQYPPYNANVPQRGITGYQVSNTVTVTLDDMTKAGPTLDALVAAGANQAGGIEFSIHDSDALMQKAREAAVADAIERAQTYAKAAGVTLGPIVSINEGGAEPPQPMFKAAMASVTGARTPIAGGEQTLSATVTISWQIQ